MTLHFPEDNPAVPDNCWLCVPTPEELSTQQRYFLRYEGEAKERFQAEYTGLMSALGQRLISADIADFTEKFFSKSPEVQVQIINLLDS